MTFKMVPERFRTTLDELLKMTKESDWGTLIIRIKY